MARGIEVFGRGATYVETAPREAGPRTRGLGVLAVLVGILTGTLTGLGVAAVQRGDPAAGQWLAIGGIGCGILGALLGLAAMATGRGRGLGALGALLSLLANPWILTRVLEYCSTLVG